MPTALKWVEMLLQNSKAVVSILLVLLSALGLSLTANVAQDQKITELENPTKVVIEMPDTPAPAPAPAPVKAKPHSHDYRHDEQDQQGKDIKSIQGWLKEHVERLH